MKLLPRPHLLSLSGILFAAVALAQVAPPATAPSDPTKRNPPPEIMPPKPEMRPPGGQKAVEPPPAAPLSPGSKAPPTEPPQTEQRALLDSLPEAELEQILTVLKQRYVSPASLADLELKRATVQGLLDRLGPAVTIVNRPPASPEASPFRTEILEERAGYVRLGTISKENLAELDKALAAIEAKALGSCILDLRATPAGTDFELAAEVCRRFCPKGKVLFTIHRQGAGEDQIYTSKSDPKFRGLPLLLVDGDTTGSAELVAGTLRALARAIVIGQRSKGEAAEFGEAPLSGGRILRFAVAEARLPGGESILTTGVTPDLPVEMTPEAVTAVLKQELEKGIAALLSEPERPHMNEAALVAGTNPELDAMQAAQRLRGEKPKALLRDQMLLRALDLITSVAILKKF